jgi:hypothetical protein
MDISSPARSNHRRAKSGDDLKVKKFLTLIPKKERANLISQTGLYLCRQRPDFPELAEELPHTWRVQYHRPCGVSALPTLPPFVQVDAAMPRLAW